MVASTDGFIASPLAEVCPCPTLLYSTEVQEEKITHNEAKGRAIRSDLNFKIKIIGELKSKD